MTSNTSNSPNISNTFNTSNTPNIDNTPAAPSTAWFEEARFGMFIHFGLYSIPGGVWKGKRMGRNDYAEWIRYQIHWPDPLGMPRDEYDTLLPLFNPTRFNADEWAAAAADAGMRYLIITSKHHDGFALWDSKVSSYSVARATPFRRDLLGELSDACRRHGLRFGFYYSHWLDWDHPCGAVPPWIPHNGTPPLTQPTPENFEKYWTEKCLPQVKELLEGYAPDLMWFDSWDDVSKEPFLTPERLGRLLALVRSTRPECLVNSRIGTTEGVDYISTGDNEFPTCGFDRPWETSGTFNHSWGYHCLDFKWKPASQLLSHLVDNASRGGNYQLNVGPTGEGLFQPAAIRRLREVGAWLGANGSAIYGSRPAPYPEPAWGRLTLSRPADGEAGQRLNAFVYAPQPGAELILAGPLDLPRRVTALETGEPVEVESVPEGLRFRLPAVISDNHILVVVFEW